MPSPGLKRREQLALSVLDTGLLPVSFRYAPGLLKDAADRYWESKLQFGVSPIISPSLDGETPIGVFTQFPDPMEPALPNPVFGDPIVVPSPVPAIPDHVFHNIWQSLSEIARVAFSDFFDRLSETIGPISYKIKMFIILLPDALNELLQSTKERLAYVLAEWGLTDLLPASLSDLPHFITSAIIDSLALVSHVLTFATFGLRLIAFLMQDTSEFHGPDHLYRESLRCGKLVFDIPEAAIPVAQANLRFPTSLPQRLIRAVEDATEMTYNDTSREVFENVVNERFQGIRRSLNALPNLIFPEHFRAATSLLDTYQEAFPQFNICTGVTMVPHPELANARIGFRDSAAAIARRLGRPVKAIGASNSEALFIPNLVANDWPTLSGRDAYRKRSNLPVDRDAHAALQHDHRMQDCDGLDHLGLPIGPTTIWSFFSAHDIPVTEFIEAMVRGGSTDALVALHLPFPLLDRRVTEYVDPTLRMRYVKEGSKLLCFYEGEKVAGYTHDFETVYQWMTNMPVYSNAHINLEAVAQVGTAVLLHLTIGEGKAEVAPSVWSCQRQNFYILPELLGRDLRRGDARPFAVESRKFEQIVAYCATLSPVEREIGNLIAKIRGMMAAIVVGKISVEERWSVTLAEMYSLAHHAVLAHDLYTQSTAGQAQSLRAYYSRTSWRNGGFLKRRTQQTCDLLTGRANGECDPSSNTTWFQELTSNHYDHTHTFNPYVRAGQYYLAATADLSKVKAAPPALRFTGKALLQAPRVALKAAQLTAAGAHAVFRFIRPVITPEMRLAINAARRPNALIAEELVAELELEHELRRERRRLAVAAGRQVRRPRGPRGPPPPPPQAPVLMALAEVLAADIDEDEPDYRPRPFFEPSVPVDVQAPEEEVQQPAPAPPVVDDGLHREPEPIEAVAIEAEVPDVAPVVEVEVEDPVLDSDSDEDDVAVPPMPAVPQLLLGLELDEALPVDVGAQVPVQVIDAWKLANAQHLRGMPPQFISPHSPRDMDFRADLFPGVRQHPADDVFYGQHVNRVELNEHSFPINMPTHGGLALLREMLRQEGVPAFESPRTDRGENRWRRNVILHEILGLAASPDAQMQAALERKANAFADFLHRHGTRNYRGRKIALLGPAMCAKSSLFRLFAVRSGRPIMGFVPSNKLVAEWMSDAAFANRRPVVRTRCSELRPPRAGAPRNGLGFIDEVFNFSAFELSMHIRALFIAGCSHVFLLGDPCQREQTGLAANSRLLVPAVHMHTSLGLPRDAHFALVRLNALDPHWYTTTSPLAHSIFFSSQEAPRLRLNPPTDLVFKPHSFYASARDAPYTIGQVQGARANSALLLADSSTRLTGWLTQSPNRLSVALTRHRLLLVVHANAASVLNYFTHGVLPPHIPLVQSSRAQLAHTLGQQPLDHLLSGLTGSNKMKDFLARLRARLPNAISNDVHTVKFAPRELMAPERPSVVGNVLRADIQQIAFDRANADLLDPAEMDFVVDTVLRSRVKFSPPGPPVPASNVRNDIKSSEVLAAIQSNRSAFDGLRNIFERQLARSKSANNTPADVAEGARMYHRFRKCFYRERAEIIVVEKAFAWLIETKQNALQAIVNGEPLGETSRSLQVSAELKTQSKFKAKPYFRNSPDAYGQSILANSKQFNARFADLQPLLYQNLQKLLRDDVVLDYGMSDAELSNAMRRLGLNKALAGKNNFQADVVKQDSSHTAGTLNCFLLIARDCGCSQEDLQFYAAYCQKYIFLSRTADHVKGSLSYNLGSGDPFTLIRNDIMEMCQIAMRFKHADTMTLIEKGDDVHGVIKNMDQLDITRFPSAQTTELKLDFGAFGYHAGRFHNGQRYLVDPIRAFGKHMTRLNDNETTIDILYASYVSRATDYTPAEIEFLRIACAQMYDFFNASEIDVIIHFMISLRSYDFFVKYATAPAANAAIIINPASNCLAQCVKALRPLMPKWKLRQFAAADYPTAKALLSHEQIAFVEVSNGEVFDKPPVNTILLSPGHAKLYLSL